MTGAKFWQKPDASVLYTHLTGKRTFAKVFFSLAVAAILYNFYAYSSTELRKALNSGLQQTMPVTPKMEDVQVVQQTDPNFQQCSNESELQKDGTEKATLVMLVRNREIREALSSMRNVEDRFNRRFHYPWTFLNDKPFTKEASIPGPGCRIFFAIVLIY
jgi:alpha 1,2-mannosyltransferase